MADDGGLAKRRAAAVRTALVAAGVAVCFFIAIIVVQHFLR